MRYYDKLCQIKKINDAMLDKESRTLFEARIEYMITRNADEFYKIIDTLNKDWYCQELNKILGAISLDEIIVFGCGHDGKRTRRVLERCGYRPCYFCDSDNGKVGECIEGLKVISVEELIKEHINCLVILGSQQYAKEMYYILLSNKFPKERILNPKHKIIVAQWGKQYFDVFPAKENEVFVDGGGYNGDTIFDFLVWTKGRYSKIHVFEPIGKMCKLISERIAEEGIDGVAVHKNALWNKREKLYFIEGDAGSYQDARGKLNVEGISIDEVIKEDVVSYIKMDVEGCELRALKGASNTIKRNRPRLAICIYHKPEDIIDIPTFILDLVPEYKFYIRHYCSNNCTVCRSEEIKE